jgi:hypothetical protein
MRDENQLSNGISILDSAPLGSPGLNEVKRALLYLIWPNPGIASA